jgi:alanine-glyoxylate transaminase / serine-glyoxylate transaminase / serine-pyruvate transaminase
MKQSVITDIKYKRLNPPERTLFGPDLSNSSPRARQGLIGILEGATDPDYLKVIEEARGLLRSLWRTANEDTFLVPGTEEAGMEAVLVNMLEPGDTAVVATAGWNGDRLAEATMRVGAKVVKVEAEWGRAVPSEAIAAATSKHRPRLLLVVHGEASTGIQQPLEGLGDIAHASGALLAVDACSTTALVDLRVDDWGIDACWSGSQKGLSAYPGLALVTFSPRAAERFEQRKQPVASYYFDLAGLRAFATDDRHHQTSPSPLVYALTEVLQLAYEQQMEYREGRHRNRRDALVAALETMGLKVLGEPEHRLPAVTVVEVPAGVDGHRVRDRLLKPFRIDIGGGVGRWRDRVWRIGIMSHSAQPSFLVQFVALLETILAEEGYPIPRPGAAVRAAVAKLEP